MTTLFTPIHFLTATTDWLEATELATAVRQSAWLYPTLESIHVVAIALLIGAIAMVDLRLVGLYQSRQSVSTIADTALPLTWIAFPIAAVTGALMFASQAGRFLENTPFLIKIGLLALAGVNMTVLHLTVWRAVRSWEADTHISLQAQFAGFVSLALWVAVVVFGRWIGFV